MHFMTFYTDSTAVSVYLYLNFATKTCMFHDQSRNKSSFDVCDLLGENSKSFLLHGIMILLRCLYFCIMTNYCKRTYENLYYLLTHLLLTYSL